MKQLKEKVVLITGAGSGIGRALAIQFAKEGSRVALNDINAANLEQTKILVHETGGRASLHLADISSRSDVLCLSNEVITIYGKIDIIINNAGASLARMDVHEASWEQWEWMMNVNFWGTLNCVKIFYPYLQERPEAHIVNVSSVFSLSGIGQRGAYCAAKFAVRGLTECMIQEAFNTNIFVSSVLPGGVSTKIAFHAKGWKNDKLRDQLAIHNANKAMTTPENAAKVIINGIKKKKKRILIGSDAKLMDIIVRFFSPFAEQIIRLLVTNPENKLKQKIVRSYKELR